MSRISQGKGKPSWTGGTRKPSWTGGTHKNALLDWSHPRKPPEPEVPDKALLDWRHPRMPFPVVSYFVFGLVHCWPPPKQPPFPKGMLRLRACTLRPVNWKPRVFYCTVSLSHCHLARKIILQPCRAAVLSFPFFPFKLFDTSMRTYLWFPRMRSCHTRPGSALARKLAMGPRSRHAYRPYCNIFYSRTFRRRPGFPSLSASFHFVCGASARPSPPAARAA